jgi:hypothetical protein
MSLGLTIILIGWCILIAALFMLSLGKCASKPLPKFEPDHVKTEPPVPSVEPDAIGARRSLKPVRDGQLAQSMHRYPSGRWTIIPAGKLTKILK